MKIGKDNSFHQPGGRLDALISLQGQCCCNVTMQKIHQNTNSIPVVAGRQIDSNKKQQPQVFALAEDLIGAALRQSVIFLSPLCSFQLPRIHYTHPLCCFCKMPGMCLCVFVLLLILLSKPMYDIRFSTAKSSCVASPLRQNPARNKNRSLS